LKTKKLENTKNIDLLKRKKNTKLNINKNKSTEKYSRKNITEKVQNEMDNHYHYLENEADFKEEIFEDEEDNTKHSKKLNNKRNKNIERSNKPKNKANLNKKFNKGKKNEDSNEDYISEEENENLYRDVNLPYGREDLNLSLEENDNKSINDNDSVYMEQTKHDRTLIIKNLEKTINEQELKSFIEENSPDVQIEDVRIVKDKKGFSRGFAFVDFYDKKHAEICLDYLNGKLFEGEILSVAISKPPSSG